MGKETITERRLSLGADYVGRKALTCRWVYKVKMNDQEYKARLVAHGFDQIFDSDYKTFVAPLCSWSC
jgi:hypothetical protein